MALLCGGAAFGYGAQTDFENRQATFKNKHESDEEDIEDLYYDYNQGIEQNYLSFLNSIKSLLIISILFKGALLICLTTTMMMTIWMVEVKRLNFKDKKLEVV